MKLEGFKMKGIRMKTGTNRISFLLFVLTFAAMTCFSASSYGNDNQPGRIAGVIVDSETGEALPGATVMLENTTIGAFCDLDGAYNLSDIPPGDYNLVVFLMGYTKKTITGINVAPGKYTKINVVLKPEPIMGREVVVVAKSLKNTEAALLSRRQRSASVSDAISAEALARYGSSDAGDAMKMVTGASVMSGKYVYIRGLGERYSNAHLNGSELPSADPDKKAFQMDLLPANLLENITVIKSFTPDQPGNFSGGIIDIETKTFPERFTVKFSMSGSYNTRSSLNSDFLTYKGGGRDWMGMDDGARSIPDAVKGMDIPDYGSAVSDPDLAHDLDAASKAFSSTMSPTTKTAPVNRSFSLSIGNQDRREDQKLGYLASLSYSHKFEFYDDGQVNRWTLVGASSNARSLNEVYSFADSRGTDEVIWGGLFTLSYRPGTNYELGLNFIHTQSGDSEARYLYGHFFDGNLREEDVYETRVLRYTERTLNSFQLNGIHDFGGHGDARFEWTAVYSENSQNEPDLRFFSDHFSVDTIDNVVDTSYFITPSIYKVPQRYFRRLDEDNLSFNSKLTIPFNQWGDLPGKLSLGGLASKKQRHFDEKLYRYRNQHFFASYDSLGGDDDAFFSGGNTGIVDSSGSYYIFENYIVDASEARSNYQGVQDIGALFAMIDLPLSARFRLVGGLRYEMTYMEVATDDTSYEKGDLDEKDVLPSASLVYRITDNMNLRFAYGKTLARPTMREMAPFPSFDFANDYFFVGNPYLKRTLIDNVDVRWEWFTRPGEILAAGLFYKVLSNPIERAFVSENGEIQYQNVDEATVYGTELELRKRLDFIGSFFAGFQFGGNLSLVYSRVDIPATELNRIRHYNPDTETARPLQGQSPYILNLDLAYDNEKTGTMAGLSFNVFGDRLSEVSDGDTPDIYEKSRPDLDFIMNQNLGRNLGLKFSVKNILDSETKKVYTFKDTDYIYQLNKKGVTVALGLSYDIK